MIETPVNFDPINGEPLLTICIPTYNREESLKQCVKSILYQKPPPNVEILICDNASPDGTEKMVSNLLENNPNIRYIRNEMNLGLDANVLKCLRNGRGKFLQLLSDDDFLDEGAISYLVDFLKRNQYLSTVILNWDHFKFVNSEIKYYWNWYSIGEPIFFENKNKFLSYILSEGLTFISNKVYNSSIFRKIDGLEKFIGTIFIQSYIMLYCLELDQNSAVIRKVMVHQGDVNRERSEMTMDFAISIFHDRQYAILDHAKNNLKYQADIINDLFYRCIKSEWRTLIIIRNAYHIKPSLKLGKRFNRHFKSFRSIYTEGIIASILPLWLIRLAQFIYKSINYESNIPQKDIKR